MNMIPSSPLRSKATALLVLIGSLVATASLNAQVYLTFTGGGGTAPVTVSWSTPITYTLAFDSPNFPAVNPYFVFQNVANSQTAFPVQASVGGVAPTYVGSGTGSNDGLQTITTFYGGISLAGAQNAVHANDLVFFSSSDTAATHLTAGDVITLSAGSLVYSFPSNGSYSGTMPTSGFYNSFVVDPAYANLGATGVSAIPEPSTYAAIAGAAMLGLAVWQRRRGQRAGAGQLAAASV